MSLSSFTAPRTLRPRCASSVRRSPRSGACSRRSLRPNRAGGWRRSALGPVSAPHGSRPRSGRRRRSSPSRSTTSVQPPARVCSPTIRRCVSSTATGTRSFRPRRRSISSSSTAVVGNAARPIRCEPRAGGRCELVAAGGVVVMDNLTPEHLWPADGPTWPDALREFWLRNDALVGDRGADDARQLGHPRREALAVDEEELLPGRPPVVGLGDDRAVVEELDALLEAHLAGGGRVLVLDFHLARLAGVVRRDGLQV